MRLSFMQYNHPSFGLSTPTQTSEPNLSFLAHIRECNAYDPARFRPLVIAGKTVGWIRPETAPFLDAHRKIFKVGNDRVEMSEGLQTPQVRTQAIGEVMEDLAAKGHITPLRHEMYAICEDWGAEELCRVDRAGVHALGILATGVHLNGFVGRGKDQKLWVARRARNKPIAPGKLDHLVAGGQPAGIGLMENVVKECEEEAAIPEELARQAVAVGAVRYRCEKEQGLRNDIIFCYDLECPADFTPRPNDGEVEDFELWPVARVMDTVRNTRNFKFNVPLVIIDFLIRHGHLTAENEPDYLALINGLRG